MFALRHKPINGHDVAYRMAGTGPTVLLIHGIGGDSATWLEVMSRLATSCRVLAPDLLGHGDSEKPVGDYSLGAHASFLRDLLARLGIRRATLVGHSFGGGIALQLAYQHPHLSERIVLEASGGLGREISSWLRLLALPGMQLALPLIAPPFVRDAGDALISWLDDRGVRSPRMREGWRAYSSLVDAGTRRAFVRELCSVVDYRGQLVSASDRLHLCAGQPTLIVWGDRDSMIPIRHGWAAHAAIPGSRIEIFEGAGHVPHAEQPDRFAALLGAFIKSSRAKPAVRRARRPREKASTRSSGSRPRRVASVRLASNLGKEAT